MSPIVTTLKETETKHVRKHNCEKKSRSHTNLKAELTTNVIPSFIMSTMHLNGATVQQLSASDQTIY